MGDILPVFDPLADAGQRFKSPAVRAEIAELFPEGVAPGSISEADLANAAVTEAKLAAGAVTHTKIGAQAVQATNLAAESVTSSKIAPDSVGPEHVDLGVVTAQDDAGNDMALRVVKISAANFAALATPDPNTAYFIY